MGRMRSALPSDLSRILRFGAVGLINTALGYTLIQAGLALGLSDIVSNATGFAAGLTPTNAKWPRAATRRTQATGIVAPTPSPGAAT
ncbi:hypothetical protein GCM10007881_27650 [Mesorhizobium huakuii]|nr:hypothetical protein GCM10007881_27650 [Mesorhizobium huakuii]